VAFVAVEFFAGLQARSLALISDAGHNFTDALALLLAWVAFYFESMPANEVKTYGYQRAGVLAAFVNALTLGVLAVFIFREAWRRLWNPEPVHETTMLVIAALGLAVNAAIMWGLHRDQHDDLNVRAAYVHMLGDALGSVGIIAGALVIRRTGWSVVDPILSILIGGLIVWTAWEIIRDTLNILLEGLPRGMSLAAVAGSLMKIEGVRDVHDLHIWSLGTRTHALSCHVLIDDMPPSESGPVLERINAALRQGFGIHHTTIQFEHSRCALPVSGCPLPAAGREQAQ
jgi:cobalt-zinc-cadmium efflux system protein